MHLRRSKIRAFAPLAALFAATGGWMLALDGLVFAEPRDPSHGTCLTTLEIVMGLTSHPDLVRAIELIVGFAAGPTATIFLVAWLFKPDEPPEPAP